MLSLYKSKKLPAIKGLFNHSERFDQGINTPGIKPETSVSVSVDGTGDFETILEAVNELGSTGGIITIREGTYTIDTALVLVSNTTIQGTGKATKIVTTGNVAGIAIASGKTDITIKDIYLYGSGAGAANSGVTMQQANNGFIIENCWIENFGANGLLLSGSNSIRVNNCVIKGNAGTGIFIQTFDFGATSGDENIITANTIDGNGSHGIHLSAAEMGHTSRNIMDGNMVINNTGTGILIALVKPASTADRNSIINNTVTGNGTAITDGGTNTTNANNTV